MRHVDELLVDRTDEFDRDGVESERKQAALPIRYVEMAKEVADRPKLDGVAA
jgi:hypothetical protein